MTDANPGGGGESCYMTISQPRVQKESCYMTRGKTTVVLESFLVVFKTCLSHVSSTLAGTSRACSRATTDED
eukprot:3539126-Pyramimonas_sp.AAC.1